MYKYEKQITTEGCSLDCCAENEVLTIKLQVKSEKDIKNYQINLTSLQFHQELSGNFHTFKEFIQYISIPANILVNKPSGVVEIISKSNTKNGYFLIAKLRLTRKKDQALAQLDSIIKKCEKNDSDISNRSTLNWITSTFGTHLQKLLLNKKQNESLQKSGVRQYNQDKQQVFSQMKQLVDRKIGRISQEMKNFRKNTFEQISEIKKQIQAQLNFKLQKLKSDFSSTNEEIKKVKHRLSAHFQKNTEERYRQLAPKSYFENLQKQVSEFEMKINMIQNKQEQTYLYNKEQQLKTGIIPNKFLILKPLRIQSLIDPDCKNYANFSLQKNLLTLKQVNYSNKGSYAFFRVMMKNKVSVSFALIQCQTYISLGIADTRLKYQTSVNSEYWFCFGSDGNSFNGKQWEKKVKSFKEGQVITIIPNFNEGKVQFKVGPQIRFSCKSESLKQKQVSWVPFVYMSNRGDSLALFID